ncbi:MAG: hypothetical protein HYT72_01235 [Candidatus Aenigmarchaeota archaeon]|nr:hypothetical protein [Candidatus Aenigmarchaeota archaeon]
MTDFIGGLTKPRSLEDVKAHFTGKGYEIIANHAVYRGDILVGMIGGKDGGYVFVPFEGDADPQCVKDAIEIAKESGLPVLPGYERSFIVKSDTYGT